MRPSTLAILLASLAPAAAVGATDRPCVTVAAPAAMLEPVEQALADRGISGPTDGCVAITLTLDDAGAWTVARPDGVVARRVLAEVEVGAAWVDSLVRSARLAEVLEPPVAPPSVSEAPPPAEGIALFASFEAWRANQPVATVDDALSVRSVSPKLVGEGGLEPMWAVDRAKRDARGDGRVFAFESGGEVYVHDGSPLAHRGVPFGRLAVVGAKGVFQREVCHWVQTGAAPAAGFVNCEAVLRLLDLETGEITPVTRRLVDEMVAAHPDLAAAWDAQKPKHVGTMKGFVEEALARPSR